MVRLLTAVLGAALAAQPFGASGAPPLDRDAERWVKHTLQRMTLDDRIGQVLVPSFESTYMATDSQAFDTLAGFVRDQHVGGFIAFGGSQPTPDVLLNSTYASVTLGHPFSTAATFNRLQALAAVPLLTAADFEWGVGMRIAGATSFPRAMAFGAAGDERLVAEAARVTAIEARALGVHVNFAPVADVNNNARNPVINTRSFGENPAVVSSMVSSYIRSLQSHGVLATLKHFPGHGDTDVDSHLGLPVIAHPRERLAAIELPPFRAGIAAGAEAVMTSHIVLPALDARRVPATFSGSVAAGLLRNDLGFRGLVFTDSMKMAGVTQLAPAGEAAVRAFVAGHDMLLDLPDPAAAFDALKAAVASGAVPGTRLAESVERILRAKARLGLHRQKLVSLDALPNVVGSRAHASVAQAARERGITLVRDERGTVPLRLSANAAALYVSALDYPGGWGIAAPSRTMAPELRKRWPNLTAVELSDETARSELDLLEAMVDRYDAVIASVFVRASSASGRMDLATPVARTLNRIARRAGVRGAPFVTVLFGNPYVAAVLPDVPAMLLTYDFYDGSELAAVRAITGDSAIGGRLPIALPGLFPVGHGLTRRPFDSARGREAAAR